MPAQHLSRPSQEGQEHEHDHQHEREHGPQTNCTVGLGVRFVHGDTNARRQSSPSKGVGVSGSTSQDQGQDKDHVFAASRTTSHPAHPGHHRFQATVEDDGSDSSPPDAKATRRPSSPSPSPSSRSTTESYISAAPSSTSQPQQPTYHGTLTPPSSRESSPRRRPTVHFSTRHPVVLHHRSNSVVSSSSISASTSSSSSSDEEGDGCRSASHRETRRRLSLSMAEDDGTTPRLSVVDKQWGTLFTEHGHPTRRLGLVLRGLANYIIREYEPSCSLVIPPNKLYTFYKKYRLDDEQFPFQGIFDYQSRHAIRNLELLYQDLSCEYHLIQDHHHTRPSTPALTPTGLQTWLTAFIQASPGYEADRLSRILLDVPLETDSSFSCSSSYTDQKPERLPKQLSRHLLPSSRNDGVCKEIVTALEGWNSRMGGSAAPSDACTTPLSEVLLSPPPPPLPRVSINTNNMSMAQRERQKVYIMDDGDHHRRNSTQHKGQHVTVSPANTGRPRLRQQDQYMPPSTPAPPIHVSNPRYVALNQEDSRSRRSSLPSHHPSSGGNLSSDHTKHRSSRDASPSRTKHHSSGRHRDRSPKAQRAYSRDRYDGKGRHKKQEHYSTRHHNSLSSHDKKSRSGRSSVSPAGAGWGSITPEPSPARAESYRFFQGRGTGPKYDDLWRDKERISA
ncbi:hypothetical protein QQS21_010568 [Conoideocrella luteorostrata]|uniref:DUF7514 domain-containing protein n=1 Tax=Conoideocrella luteorostrata TaxID=1105319 RepID=A0AAJ0FPB0_9HYPO|nr:hypothetical protein QQS21_010568 [Conoideocrella luteorostrata]